MAEYNFSENSGSFRKSGKSWSIKILDRQEKEVAFYEHI